jgi:hypothetical protein
MRLFATQGIKICSVPRVWVAHPGSERRDPAEHAAGCVETILLLTERTTPGPGDESYFMTPKYAKYAFMRKKHE